MTQSIRLALRFLVLLVLAPLLTAATCSEAKPIVQTTFDVARSFCVLLNSEQKPGLSAREIADTLCASEAQIRPYLNVLLNAKQGLTQPESDAGTVPPKSVTVLILQPIEQPSDAGTPAPDGGQ